MSRPGRSCSTAPDYRLARGISRPQLDKRTREEPCSSLGIGLNIWTLSLPSFFLFFFFSPANKLETKPGSRRPLPTCALEERGENRKLPRQELLSGETLPPFSLAHPRGRCRLRKADLRNLGLRKSRSRTLQERSPHYLGPRQSGGAFLPELPGTPSSSSVP